MMNVNSVNGRMSVSGLASLSDERLEVCAAVHEAVGRLSARQREAVLLRYWDERSYAEIAMEINAPLGTVGVLISRALQRLKPLLKDLAP